MSPHEVHSHRPRAGGFPEQQHAGRIAAERRDVFRHPPQRAALEVRATPGGGADYVEELVVRRELADNFCFYQPQSARETAVTHTCGAVFPL